jgi:formate dehydrogenase subunit gamma
MMGKRDFDVESARNVIAAERAQAIGFYGPDGETATAMLPMLHALQETFGYVDRAVIPLIADSLNISKAEVHGAITFYHDFKDKPHGAHVLKICRAEACQSMGAERVVSHLATCGHKVDTTSSDGRLSIETVYCLGNCALAPAALLDDELIGRFDENAAESVLALAKEGR